MEVLFRRNGKLFTGEFDASTLKILRKKEVSGKLKDLRGEKVNLSTFLWQNSSFEMTKDEFLKQVKADKIYFGEDSAPMTKTEANAEVEFEKWFWKKYNAYCMKCKKNCKQSWKVTVETCKQFEK